MESNGDLASARALLVRLLALVPRGTDQEQWARDRIQHLDWEMAQKNKYQSNPTGRWAKVLGPLGAAGALLAKSKGLLFLVFKLKFLLSFASFIAIYWALFDMWFGIGFATLILVHELGHFVDIKRRGLPAELPVFLPGLGAYVKWQALGVPLDVRAAISLAGPLAGLLGATVCAAIYQQTHLPIWAALARTTAWLNVLNLIPVWQLDGAQAAQAISKAERVGLCLAALAYAFMLREGVFAFLALGLGWRVFTKDAPAQGSIKIALYYFAVMTGLGALIFILPGSFTR
ncbi:MAG: hypothetical protein NVS9B15_12510 [Acidobacteriaceae bacterium]